MQRAQGEEEIKSIVRVFGVLEALNQADVNSVDRLHRLTKLPKPTLIRVLKTLVGLGYVFHVSRLSAGFRYRDAIVDVARPLLEDFTARHKWQISIATPDGAYMRVRFNTRHVSPFAPDQLFLNRRIGVLNTAMGLAYLAFCPHEGRDVILKLVQAADPDQAAATQHLDERLAIIRAQRYATVVRGAGDRVRSFAVPVLAADGSGAAIASLAMFYFVSTMSEREATERYLEAITGVGEAIAAALVQTPRFGAHA